MKRTLPLRRVGARPAGTDVVLDLGTANVRIHQRGHGVVLNEPSLVAVDSAGAVAAAGSAATVAVRADPASLRLHRPLGGGVIVDAAAASAMVRWLFAAIGLRGGHSVVVSVPSDITAQQRVAFQDVVLEAGARACFVIEDPVAAAIGTGLEIADETPNLLVDAGAGTTDVAVLAAGGIALSQSIPLGGDDVDVAIAHHLLSRHGLRISQRSAERTKVALPGVLGTTDDADLPLQIHGRAVLDDTPASVSVSALELMVAVEPVVAAIAQAVRTTLDRAPATVAADLVDRPVLLTGGTALLSGLDTRIATLTGLEVRVSDDPLYRVAVGAGACLDTAEDLATVFAGAGRWA